MHCRARNRSSLERIQPKESVPDLVYHKIMRICLSQKLPREKKVSSSAGTAIVSENTHTFLPYCPFRSFNKGSQTAVFRLTVGSCSASLLAQLKNYPEKLGYSFIAIVIAAGRACYAQRFSSVQRPILIPMAQQMVLPCRNSIVPLDMIASNYLPQVKPL
jgi:hypothetical protein